MKLHLYSAKDSPSVPDQPRLADLDTVGAPYRAAAQAAGVVGHEALAWGQQLDEMKKREDEAKGEVEAIKLQTEYERALVNRDIQLRGEDDYDYNVHDQKLDEAGQQLLEEYAGKAKSPIAAKKFRVAAMRGLKEKVIHAKYEAKQRLDGEQDAANYDQNQQVAIKAADTADAKLRAIKIEEQVRFNYDAANRGRIRPEEAGKRSRQLREDVDVILARRAMKADPEQFLLDLEEPDENGEMRWKNIPATRRQALEEQAVKLAERKGKDTDRINKEHSGAIKKHLIDRMDSGVNADVEIRALRDSLTDEDYDHVLERNKRLYSAGPDQSDKPTYTRLEVGIREGTITEYKDVDDFKHLLTIPHYTHLLGLIDQKRDKGKDKKESDAEKTRDRLVASGRVLLGSIYRTTGSFADIDAESEAAKALALAEFEARSAREKDRDPTELATEIMMKYAKMIREQIGARPAKNVAEGLVYRTEAELKAAKDSKQITLDEFIAQKRLLEYWIFLDTKTRPNAGSAPASGDKPPSGGSSTPAKKSRRFSGSQGMQ